MITTHETIDNPPEFIIANPDLFEGLLYEPEILSGRDYDVLIDPGHPPSQLTSLEGETSRVLGNLYKEGIADLRSYDGNAVRLTWFPSPTAANELIERLDMTPGSDVLRFTHAPDIDRIPPSDFVSYIRSGMFPQSSDKRERIDGADFYFEHNRDGSHAVSALLSPPELTQAYKKHPCSFDPLSSDLRVIMDYLWEQINKGMTAAQTDFDVLLYHTPYSVERLFNHTLWGFHERGLRTVESKLRYITDLLCGHLVELQPKIQREQGLVARATPQDRFIHKHQVVEDRYDICPPSDYCLLHQDHQLALEG